jgi:uncharacterized protein YndB with AHSA1/START domain
MHVQRSIEIAAPPAKVWPLLVEPDDVMRWYPTLRTFRYVGDMRGQGAHIYAEEQGAGLMKLDFVVTEWTRDRAIALHMTKGTGVAGYEQRWTLEPTPAGTQFTFSEDVELPYGVPGRVIGRFVRRTSERHVEEMLGKLKALTEA